MDIQDLLNLAEQYSWLIVVLPIIAFALISILIISAGKAQRAAQAAAPWVLIVALSLSLLLAIAALVATNGHTPATGQHNVAAEHTGYYVHTINWMTPQPAADGKTMALKIGILLDPLSALMLVVVLIVSLVVQIYSLGYMKRDEQPRFYLYMSLFTASMLGLVISSTLLQLFIFWELVGLCSYLLIGFWYRKPEAAKAAIKAFVVTRFGDLGLLIAVIALWMQFGDLSFAYLQAHIHPGIMVAGLPLVAIALLIFFGACGKSAQFPLHIWLPDAMEGPTSVSALIHAATMVAAGVFLVARMFFLFQAAPVSLVVVALIGGFTAIFAATIALVQDDMKKVMAYSTISQLGYMMMGLGLAAPAAAFFHLSTHAFFKALLFLTAGAVIHAAHTQNMWEMGGLFKKMKVTAITCAIGGLALAGIFPFAGFFSKDKLLESSLAAALGHGAHGSEALSPALAWIILFMALATVLLTAFYTTRMWALVFLGSPRSAGAEKAHEAPISMRLALIVLAAITCVAGYFILPDLVAKVGSEHAQLSAATIHLLTAAALGLALVGLLAGLQVYAKRTPAREPLLALGPLYRGMVNLWYVDALFVWLAHRVVIAFGTFISFFDKRVVDGMLVDGVAWITGRFGHAIRRASAGPLPGQLQFYALVMLIIVALMLLCSSLHMPFDFAVLLGGTCR